MTTAKNISDKNRLSQKSKAGSKKRIQPELDKMKDAANSSTAKPNIAQKAWAAVKSVDYKKVGATAKKGTNKTLGFAWGASWRTAVTGVLVPFASYYANTVAQSYHAAVAKGAHYSSTAKEAWAQMLNAVSPAVDKIADHPITSTLVAAAAWVIYRYTKPTAK
jgi:hypothetical protein